MYLLFGQKPSAQGLSGLLTQANKNQIFVGHLKSLYQEFGGAQGTPCNVDYLMTGRIVKCLASGQMLRFCYFNSLFPSVALETTLYNSSDRNIVLLKLLFRVGIVF